MSAGGMHARGVGVSRLDEQTLMVMTADEVLGGWGLLREWRQQEGAGAGGNRKRKRAMGVDAVP